MLRCAKFLEPNLCRNFLVPNARAVKRRSKVEPAGMLTLLFGRVAA